MSIGRAMYFKAKLLILDEPVTALSVKETKIVLKQNRKGKRVRSFNYIHNS